MNIIGIGGGIGSGKSTAASFYKEHGYKIIETSDLIREELEKEGISSSSRLQRIQKAHELVENYGKGILGTLASEKARTIDAENIVICGLRNPEQISAIKAQFHNAIFIFIEASPQMRLERAQKRDKITEPQALEHLRQMIKEENNPEGNTSMHLPKTKKASHIEVLNNESIENFHKSISSLFIL